MSNKSYMKENVFSVQCILQPDYFFGLKKIILLYWQQENEKVIKNRKIMLHHKMLFLRQHSGQKPSCAGESLWPAKSVNRYADIHSM